MRHRGERGAIQDLILFRFVKIIPSLTPKCLTRRYMRDMSEKGALLKTLILFRLKIKLCFHLIFNFLSIRTCIYMLHAYI